MAALWWLITEFGQTRAAATAARAARSSASAVGIREVTLRRTVVQCPWRTNPRRVPGRDPAFQYLSTGHDEALPRR